MKTTATTHTIKMKYKSFTPFSYSVDVLRYSLIFDSLKNFLYEIITNTPVYIIILYHYTHPYINITQCAQ